MKVAKPGSRRREEVGDNDGARMTNTEGKPKPKGQMDRAARIIGGGTGADCDPGRFPGIPANLLMEKQFRQQIAKGGGLELTRAATGGTFLGFWR